MLTYRKIGDFNSSNTYLFLILEFCNKRSMFKPYITIAANYYDGG